MEEIRRTGTTGVHHVIHSSVCSTFFVQQVFFFSVPLSVAQGLQPGFAPRWRHSPRACGQAVCGSAGLVALRPASVASVALQALAVPFIFEFGVSFIAQNFFSNSVIHQKDNVEI